MIAGGIGITPFHRLFQGLDDRSKEEEIWLFYGNRLRDEIIYKEEIESLDRIRVVHVLSEEKEYEGETGYITSGLLKKYLQRNPGDYEFLICGPPAMTATLEKALVGEEGVPSEQIHHEMFSY
jgi:NAD(P)H-flavin reductase